AHFQLLYQVSSPCEDRRGPRRGGAQDEVQPLLRAAALARKDGGTALPGGARADRQRGPPRLRRVRGDRALLLSEVRLAAHTVRSLRLGVPALPRHHFPDSRPRAAVPEPRRPRL